MQFVLNCVPSPRNIKDLMAPPAFDIDGLPLEVDMEPFMSPVVNQLTLGSCTANGATAFREFLEIYRGELYRPLSRSYVYYHERKTEGTLGQDAGAHVVNALGTLYTYGACEEEYFRYNVDTYNDPPSAEAEKNAPKYKISEYHRLLTSAQLKKSIADWKPVLVGFSVLDSFLTIDATGIMPMPDLQVEVEQGGHLSLIMGYKYINVLTGSKLYYKVKNSWGKDWGDHGYFWMPAEYIESRWVFDLWSGAITTPYSNITYQQAIHILADGEHIFESPQFWLNLVGNTTPSFKYWSLLARKFAADSQNFPPLTGPLDYSKLSLEQALTYLGSKLVMASPEFWLAEWAKHKDDPTSDFRFLAMAIIKYAVRRMLLFP